jgi:hypothetical protein
MRRREFVAFPESASAFGPLQSIASSITTRRRILIGAGIALGSAAASLIGRGPASAPAKVSAVRPPSAPVKVSAELDVNPFGDPWASRSECNAFIPIARLLEVPPLPAARFTTTSPLRSWRRTCHTIAPLSWLSTRSWCTRSSLATPSPNFVEHEDMPGSAEAEEAFFVHARGLPETLHTRLSFRDSGALSAHGHIIDVRNPAAHEHFARHMAAAMVANELWWRIFSSRSCSRPPTRC